MLNKNTEKGIKYHIFGLTHNKSNRKESVTPISLELVFCNACRRIADTGQSNFKIYDKLAAHTQNFFISSQSPYPAASSNIEPHVIRNVLLGAFIHPEFKISRDSIKSECPRVRHLCSWPLSDSTRIDGAFFSGTPMSDTRGYYVKPGNAFSWFVFLARRWRRSHTCTASRGMRLQEDVMSLWYGNVNSRGSYA